MRGDSGSLLCRGILSIFKSARNQESSRFQERWWKNPPWSKLWPFRLQEPWDCSSPYNIQQDGEPEQIKKVFDILSLDRPLLTPADRLDFGLESDPVDDMRSLCVNFRGLWDGNLGSILIIWKLAMFKQALPESRAAAPVLQGWALKAASSMPALSLTPSGLSRSPNSQHLRLRSGDNEVSQQKQEGSLMPASTL